MNARHASHLAWAIAVLCAAGCARRADTGEERKQIQQVFDRYLQSVKSADVKLASTVWLQSPDVVAVTPLGRVQGWDGVQRDVYVNFLQKAFLERDLRPSNVEIHVAGDSAWLV